VQKSVPLRPFPRDERLPADVLTSSIPALPTIASPYVHRRDSRVIALAIYEQRHDASRRHQQHGSVSRPAPLRGPPTWPLDEAAPPCLCFSMASLLSRITIDPEICHGKPIIRGLRYPVESMLEYLAAGDSIDDLLAQFPDLERDDLLACLEFAGRGHGE